MNLWLQYAIFGAVAGAHFSNKAVFWKYFVLSLPIMPAAFLIAAPFAGPESLWLIAILFVSVIATFALYQRGTTLARTEINENDHTNVEEVF